MRAVRAAGIPAPKVITYGSHPDTPYAPVSILMARLPGMELAEIFETEDGLNDGGPRGDHGGTARHARRHALLDCPRRDFAT